LRIALSLPSGDLSFEFCLRGDTTIQTLATEDTQFDLLCWLLLMKIVLEAIKQMSKSYFYPHG